MNTPPHIMAESFVYLRAIERLYPGGVPLHLIADPPPLATRAVSEKSSSEAKPVLLGVNSAPILFVGALSGGRAPESLRTLLELGEEGALLSAAVTKGMKLSLEDVLVANIERAADLSEGKARELNLNLFAVAVNVEIVILLGDWLRNVFPAADRGAGSKSWRDSAGRRIFLTCSLREVLENPVSKRQFWADLQAVMRELNA